MAVATGAADSVAAATARMVRLGPAILPDPTAADRYDRMMPIYSRLYESSKAYWDDLDAL
jgi:xylulokinase